MRFIPQGQRPSINFSLHTKNYLSESKHLKTPKKGNCFVQHSDGNETPQVRPMKQEKQKNNCFIGVSQPFLFHTKQLIVSHETMFHSIRFILHS